MTKELTSEDIVTSLLISNDVVKINNHRNFYISNPTLDTLSDFLLENESNIEENHTYTTSISKYAFIKSSWHI